VETAIASLISSNEKTLWFFIGVQTQVIYGFKRYFLVVSSMVPSFHPPPYLIK
jgi:hypothetical protein